MQFTSGGIMDARQLLQSKQKAIAAIKAQQYPEAVHILEEVRDASPGGTLLDPLLAEMLSTLQQKVAQDAAGSSSGEDEGTSSETGSDESGDDERSSLSEGGSSDAEPSSDPAEDDDSAGQGSQDAPGGMQQPCHVSDSSTATAQHATHLSAHAAAGTSTTSSALQDMASHQQAQLSTVPGTDAAGAQLGSCSTGAGGPQQAAAVSCPVVGAIQLAPDSCSLSHGEHAHLRQQLLASLEADKEAAALQQALADDPLLSLSLS